MNVATLIALVAVAIELVLGGLAVAFAAAPGWKHFRVFSWIAFSSAAYSAGDAALASGALGDGWLSAAAHVKPALGLAQTSLWLRYALMQSGEEPSRAHRFLMRGLFAGAVICLIPGSVVTGAVAPQSVDWAGVTYRVPEETWFGALAAALVPLVLLVPAALFFEKARQGVPGSRVHVAGFVVFYATVTNEVLVVAGLWNNLYLVDLGLLAVVLPICGEMMCRVAGDASRLQQLSRSLSGEVEQRTAELVEARSRLQRTERLTALGRLSASVGHEINNPLSYVMGNLDYVRGELEAEQAQKPELMEAIGEAISGAERIRRIVGELRVFSRGSRGDEAEVLDVRRVLDASLKLVKSQLESCATVERSYERVPCVRADATKLSQVFVNVLLNAAQAMSGGGAPRGTVTLRTRAAGEDRVRIEILDTGSGFSPTDRTRLFEPFYSTKKRDEGTGLGLFISLGIISSFGGTIDLRPRRECGTRVVIELPSCLERAAPESNRRPPSSSLRDLRQLQRLLIVDDDVLVSRSIARQLRGHEVEIVSSGAAAVQRLDDEEADYDWVLCDLMMPDMTGVDVYEAVVARRPHLSQRFVFISGGGASNRCRRFMEENEDRVLAKPIAPEALVQLLQRRQPLGAAVISA